VSDLGSRSLVARSGTLLGRSIDALEHTAQSAETTRKRKSEASLNAGATARFAAFCDELGPSVTWLRFRSEADMRHAIAADARDRQPFLDYATGCVNASRAELVAFDDVDHWKVSFLGWRRGARIVRRPAQ
jgi:hypothetical protein